MNSNDTPEGRALERAARRYAAGMAQKGGSRRIDVDAATQTDNYRAAAEQIAIIAQKVKDVTQAFRVPPWTTVPYRSFGLQLDKLIRRNQGQTLRLLVRENIDLWSARGLEPRVLTAICSTVFGLEV